MKLSAEYMTAITALQQRQQALEDQINKNSTNSSKPPSSDGYKKKNSTASLRKKSDKKTGGQQGHQGKTLEQVKNPDSVELHTVSTCGNCNNTLIDVSCANIEKRQVFDLPPLHITVTEHQVEKKQCPSCGEITTAKFPEKVTQPVQYGSSVLSLATYLTTWQLLPLWRTKETFSDIFHLNISEATILTATKQAERNVTKIVEHIKNFIATMAMVAHFDETGLRVAGKLHWLHSVSTTLLTYYAIHAKRGEEAMKEIAILIKFQGIAVHDHWKSYFLYTCQHALCNAHHLRELTFLIEQYGSSWAEKMMQLLVEIKDFVEEAKKAGKDILAKEQALQYSQQYDVIVREGFDQNPLTQDQISKKRRRIKHTKAQNLLGRLRDYKKETLRFMYDFKVPFDNNQAERDIRMTKLKQKISGCFRTFENANTFCTIRSYLSTVKKHNYGILAALESVFTDDPYIPETLRGTMPLLRMAE
jgi:transposase